MAGYKIRFIAIAAIVAVAGFSAGGCECRATATDDSGRVTEEHRIRVKAPFTDVDVRVPKKDHDEHHRRD